MPTRIPRRQRRHFLKQLGMLLACGGIATPFWGFAKGK